MWIFEQQPRLVAPSSKYRATNSKAFICTCSGTHCWFRKRIRVACIVAYGQTKWKLSTYNAHVDTTAQTNTEHLYVCVYYSLVNLTPCAYVILREIWDFPNGTAEDSVRIMGYDVSARRTVLVVKGRNFQKELRSSITEYDMASNGRYPITQWRSIICQTHGIHVNLFYICQVSTITFLNICSSGQRVVNITEIINVKYDGNLSYQHACLKKLSVCSRNDSSEFQQ